MESDCIDESSCIVDLDLNPISQARLGVASGPPLLEFKGLAHAIFLCVRRYQSG